MGRLWLDDCRSEEGLCGPPLPAVGMWLDGCGGARQMQVRMQGEMTTRIRGIGSWLAGCGRPAAALAAETVEDGCAVAGLGLGAPGSTPGGPEIT